MKYFYISTSVNSSGQRNVNGVVKQSYYKGSHYLIKAVLTEK
jgi:hypothetical protein